MVALAEVEEGAPLELWGKTFASGSGTPVTEPERLALKLLKVAGLAEWRRIVLRPAPRASPLPSPCSGTAYPLHLPGGERVLRPGLPAPVSEAEVRLLQPFTVVGPHAGLGRQLVDFLPLPVAA